MPRDISPENRFIETFNPDVPLLDRAVRMTNVCASCKNDAYYKSRSQEAQRAKCKACWVPKLTNMEMV
jgi:hypothetical protein